MNDRLSSRRVAPLNLIDSHEILLPWRAFRFSKNSRAIPMPVTPRG